MQILKDVVYGDIKEIQTLDMYLPEQFKSIFVYFHGGGLDRGAKGGMEKIAKYLSTKGIATASVNYRLYANPNFPNRPYTPAKYPDFIRDVALSVAFVKDYMQKNYGSINIYVGGSSAGGYLSMMLCFDKRWLNEAGLSNDDISGYFHDAGQPTAHFKVLMEAGFDHKRVIIDETAPLYYIGLEEKYPPMRFIVSDQDMANRYEQTMLVLSTLKHFGYTDFDHVVMHGKHVEYVKKSQADDDCVIFGEMICDFINKVESKE